MKTLTDCVNEYDQNVKSAWREGFAWGLAAALFVVSVCLTVIKFTQ